MSFGGITQFSVRLYAGLATGFFCALSIANDVRALDPERLVTQYTQRRWSVDQGLPQASANAIVQDAEGYLWIGTFGGLIRFDGVEIVPITALGSCGSRILSLAVSPDGSIWIGSERAGLCVYRNGVIRDVTPADGQPLGGVANLEITADGTVYAATGHGVLRIHLDSQERLGKANGLPHENALAFARHPDGKLWVATREGLCILEGSRCEVPSWSQPVRHAMIEAILHARDGSTWIGSKSGLHRFRDGRLETIWSATRETRIRSLLEDRSGSIWAALEPGGLMRVSPRFEILRGIDSRTNDSVNVVLEDREGHLWIGTQGDGVIKLGDGPATALEIKGEGDVTGVLPIVVEPTGRAWIGTRCGGLARLEPDGSRRIFGLADGFTNSCIWSLLPDGEGGIWVGTYGHGLFHLSESGTITRLAGLQTGEGLIRGILDDGPRSILLATDEGLFRYDRRDRSFTSVEGSEGLDIYFLTRAPDGAVWLGTQQGVRILRANRIETFDSGSRIERETIRAIHHDRDGSVWLGTYGSGLVHVRGGKVFVFGPQQGLTDPVVSRILEDERGRLWLTGNGGVTVVDRSSLLAVARGELRAANSVMYTSSDGMPASETNGGGQPAGFLDSRGVLWVPTISGIALFDTRRTTRTPVAPSVMITRVFIEGRRVPHTGGVVELPRGARNLEIRYTAPSFSAPERVRFRYRLEGFDDQWVDAGTRRVAYFPAIPAGKLRFHVTASSSDDSWNEQGASFNFVMPVTLTRTWWFWAVCLAIVTTMAAFFFRWRVATALRREQALELQVRRRTAELTHIADLTRIINEGVTLHEVLDHIYVSLRSIIPYDRIGVALLDREGSVLRAVWSRGEREAAGIGAGYESPLDGSSLKPVLLENRPRIIHDLEEYLESHPASESTRRIVAEGIRSNLTCPLRALGAPVGCMFFSSFERDAYDESHVSTLEQIAGHLAIAIGKSKLYEDLLTTKSKLEQANSELERLAWADGLTGLANRRTFDLTLEREWRRGIRSGQPLALLMIDVDGFKAYNDRWGHAAGDACLRTIAETIAGSVGRPGDLAARYGGEEFAVILTGCATDAATDLGEKIRDSIERRRIGLEESVLGPFATVSIGAASIVAKPELNPSELIGQADRALYEAKRMGKNRIVAAHGVASPSWPVLSEKSEISNMGGQSSDSPLTSADRGVGG
jgi:diguanylate cyclase (GGDEF)-like protein